ncbi:MAG: ankyrin repeat domain-containing protein [Planctomycetota bacterium]
MTTRFLAGALVVAALLSPASTPSPQVRLETKVTRLERDLTAMERRVKQLETATRQAGDTLPRPTMSLLDGARTGSFAQVRLGLVWGGDLELKDPQGRTPLLLACENKQLAMARYLLLNGADVAAKDKDGQSALDWARKHEDEALRALLEAHGAH